MKPDEIFVQASKAADAAIPGIESEITRLHRRLNELTTELNHLRMISSYGKGKPAQAELIPDTPREEAPRRGQAMELIKSVLAAGPMPASKIKIEIAKKHGNNYGLSTIYSNLSRGRSEGIFTQTSDEQWKLGK